MQNHRSDPITGYLSDVHALEEQSLQQLRSAPEIAGEPELARALREHLTETETHEARTRALLERRGGAVSRAKEAFMRAGGSGFVLFARAQSDTPGKLAAHALSYEALEWAAYDLLARVARHAGDAELGELARTIREDEGSMMQRIEALFDRTVEASLRETRRDDLQALLRGYLADAHAIEAQSIQMLESGQEMVSEPTLARVFADHLAESREQQRLVEQRLEAAGGERSLLKDAALRFGALNWGMFFQAQPDTTGKLAAFAYALEHLEIGGYEQLRRVAERAGDGETARAVQSILAQERKAAQMIAAAFEAAAGTMAGEHASR